MNSRWIPWLFMAPALALIAVVTVYPMIYSMIISFQDVRLARIVQPGKDPLTLYAGRKAGYLDDAFSYGAGGSVIRIYRY